MEPIADRKYHFAPLRRQRQEIERLLRSGRFRNATHFMRAAIDHYLDRLGRPPLADQARQMAEDWEARSSADQERAMQDAAALQEPSMHSGEPW
jgi:Arc/MetJ-type ribon-helix-helix transcriptional regulator